MIHIKNTFSKAVLGAAFLLACGISTSYAQETFRELREAAAAKDKAQDYKASTELLEKAVSKAQNNAEKNQAYARLTWLYAWGSNPNRFDKAAETYIAMANLSDTSPKNRAGNMRNAADMLNRIRDYDKTKIYAILEDASKTSELPADDKASILMYMAKVMCEIDLAKAEKDASSAIASASDVSFRNRLRMEWARALNSGKTPDTEKAVKLLNSITDDTASSPKDKFNAVMEAGKWLAAKNKFAESNAEFDKASSIDGIGTAEKTDALLAKAANLERVKRPDIQNVFATYRTVAANAEATAAQRIQAYRKMLQYMRGALSSSGKEIASLFDDMWKIDKLNSNNAREISEVAGNYYFDMKQYDKAVEEYSKCLKYDPANLAVKVAALKGRAYAAKGDAVNAGKYLLEAGKWGDFAAFQFESGKREDAYATVNGAVKSDPRNAKHALGWFANRMSYKEFTGLLENDFREFIKNDPSLGREFANKVFNAMQDGAYEFVVTAAPYVINADAKNVRARLYLVNALSQMGKIDEAKKLVSVYAAEKDLGDVEYSYRFKVIDAALKAGTRKGAFEAANKLIKEFEGLFKDRKKLALITGRAASTPLMMNLKDVAQGIDDARRGMFAFLPNSSVKCEYVENLPQDIDSWWTSDIVKNKRNVQKVEREPWEDNVDFLVATDAATVGRTIGKDAKGRIETDFYTFCDSRGVSVFIVAWDDNSEKIWNGLGGGGSYEGYMAPGALQPYYCFLIDFSTGRTDDFKTAYRNELTRRPTFKENQLESTTRLVAPNAIATLLVFPWEYFWQSLPLEKGDTWQFDVMRWTGPGYSWSGMSSVHNRSTWGDFVFELTPSQVMSIKRSVVMKARRVYIASCGSDWRGNGVYHFWNDAVLGDVKFYNECVLPLRNELDVFKKEVTADMSDAVVERLFRDAVPKFMNIRQIIERLRVDYLSDKVFE